MEEGHIPSFCTACYRAGRTGDRFMKLCKTGQIQNCCAPNAIITLKEFLEDYASADTKKTGEALIKNYLENLKNEALKETLKNNLTKIDQGERDFRF